LEKEPEERYQHISDIKNAVEHISAGAPEQARPGEKDASIAPGRPISGPRIHVRVQHWGSHRSGLLQLAGDALLLEFDAGAFIGWFSTGFGEVRLPLQEIESIRFEKKRWIKIRTFRLSKLEGIPDSYSGEAKLGVRKEDRAAAEEFVALVARRLPYAAQSA